VPPSIHALLATPGQPLQVDARVVMEGRFGQLGRKLQSPRSPAGAPGTDLEVGAIDDPREREADRLADRVTSGPASGPASAGPRSARPDARRGFDFSSIRVHHGSDAQRAAQALHARAFTVGEHIVFGAGEYQPASPEGRRLLAHELAHTLDPSGAAQMIRRAPAEPYAVTGLHPKRADEPGIVFFERGKPTEEQAPPASALDKDERAKIQRRATALAADKATKVTLFGYASEEGGKKNNTVLIGRRLDAVRTVLCETLDCTIVTIDLKPDLACSTGMVDYRFWRAVEMITGDGPRQRECGTVAPAPERGLVACDTEQKEVIEDVRKVATPDLTTVLKKLDDYIADPSKGPKVAAALDRHFARDHSTATADEVRKRIKAIKDLIDDLDRILKCGTDDRPACHRGSAAAANPGLVFFCDVFFNDPKFIPFREDALIHEVAHASGFKARDIGYRQERVIAFLTTTQALDNATSLSLFALDVVGKGLPVGPEKPDEVEECGDDETRIREALAWAERWNTYADLGIPQTYGNPEWEAYLAQFQDRFFGRHDRAAVAGIADRYTRMSKVFAKKVTITCVRDCPGTDAVVWKMDGDEPEVTVCRTFRRLGNSNERIIQMYAGLARLMPGVPRWQGRAYAELARVYKEEFWEVK
jgi:hypothetical protein